MLSSSPVGLAPNTTQYYRVKARNWNFLETAYSQQFATVSLAVTPGSPTVLMAYISSITLSIQNPAVFSNPAYTEFAIYNETLLGYLGAPNGTNESALQPTPVWLTYAGWNGASGVTNLGLIGDTAYTFRVKARNSLLVETSFSPPSESTSTGVGDPAVIASTPAAHLWVNVTSAAFTLAGSRIFHYRFNTTEFDTALESDPPIFSTTTNILITTATAEGPNYLHVRGEGGTHNFLANVSTGPINIDTTTPAGVSISNVVSTTFTLNLTASASDPMSGLAAAPYHFEETLAGAGAGSFDTSLGFQVSDSAEDAGLLPNTSYAYHVRARDIAGNISNFSALLTTATLAALPGTGGPSAIHVSSITVAWTNPYSNPSDTNYSVRFATSPDFVGRVTSSDTFSLSVTSTSMVPNTSYYMRLKAVNRRNLDSAWFPLGSTATLAAAPVSGGMTWVGVSSAAFAWTNPSNPSDTLYRAEVSSDDFASVLMSSVTLSNQIVFKPIRPSTNFKSRVVAVNRLGVGTDPLFTSSFLTNGAPALEYLTGISSITIVWDENTAPPGSEFLVESATLTAGGSTSTLTAAGAWTAGISSWTFVNLSTNTQYSYQVSWREPPAADVIFMVAGATRTLAVTPAAPQAVPLSFEIAVLILSSGTNPSADPDDTQYSILNVVSVPPGSPHDRTYVPADGNMNNASAAPVWRTFSQWGGTTGVVMTNMISGSVYNIHVKARNGHGVETSTSVPVSVVTFPSAPEVAWKTGLQDSDWINVPVTSFTATNSSHYHYRFNQTSNDTANVTPSDPGFLTNDVIVVEAAASGPWYFHAMGDTFGFQGTQLHVALGTAKFKINVDLSSPVISGITAQFSPTDTNGIEDGIASPHQDPYFVWDSTDTSAISQLSGKISPIAGYSVFFATGTDPGDAAVPYTVMTTTAAAYFQVSSGTPKRDSVPYYFRVRAKDTAGNWGDSKLFTFVFTEDTVKPTAEVNSISSVQSATGIYLGVGSSMSITYIFDKDMKSDTVVSTANVTLIGLRDNMNGTQYEVTAVTLTYNTATRTLTIRPQQNLHYGWLYELTISSAMTDLGGNRLSQEYTAQYETVLDPAVVNMIVADDGQTVVDIPAGAFSEPATVSVGVLSGGVAQAPKGGPKRSSGWHAPMFTPQSSITEANDKMKSLLGPFAQPVTMREFVAVKEDGSLIKTNFNLPVSVTMPYLDADGDGYVDGTNPRVRVKNLQVFVLDEVSNTWQKLTRGTVNSDSKTAKSNVAHFSVYSVFGVPDNDVSNAYAYPVPFKPSESHTRITFAFLPSAGNIRVFTAAGELAQKIDFMDPTDGKVLWDVTNSAGEPLASDVYIYIIESGSNRKTGKIMVIR
ncbi:MAG: hypothetical protein A3A86_01135 [Elusimicrobia bacterium RIFCSPLOWO2_01_FULL_60_11]|nr:MAG: hypothetical protein A3A86_01135 [Elusimicrobia bacterium RIFCSPLOWO2_01_FULL_60_11]